jgi:hypothetical protein
MTTTQTDSESFFIAKFSNCAYFVHVAIRAEDESEARDKALQYAEDHLQEAADEEYEMAVADDRYDPDRSEWTYSLGVLEPASFHEVTERRREIMQRRGDDTHMGKSGGNG